MDREGALKWLVKRLTSWPKNFQKTAGYSAHGWCWLALVDDDAIILHKIGDVSISEQDWADARAADLQPATVGLRRDHAINWLLDNLEHWPLNNEESGAAPDGWGWWLGAKDGRDTWWLKNLPNTAVIQEQDWLEVRPFIREQAFNWLVSNLNVWPGLEKVGVGAGGWAFVDVGDSDSICLVFEPIHGRYEVIPELEWAETKDWLSKQNTPAAAEDSPPVEDPVSRDQAMQCLLETVSVWPEPSQISRGGFGYRGWAFIYRLDISAVVFQRSGGAFIDENEWREAKGEATAKAADTKPFTRDEAIEWAVENVEQWPVSLDTWILDMGLPEWSGWHWAQGSNFGIPNCFIRSNGRRYESITKDDWEAAKLIAENPVFDDSAAQTEPVPAKPSWADAPPDAKILVQDRFGRYSFGTYAHACVDDTEVPPSYWSGVGKGKWFDSVGVYAPNPHWQETLEHRPELISQIVAPLLPDPEDVEKFRDAMLLKDDGTPSGVFLQMMGRGKRDKPSEPKKFTIGEWALKSSEPTTVPKDLPPHEKYPAYFKSVKGLDYVDVYMVHKLFDIQDPSGALQHASKKILLSGVRTGGKSAYADIKEARDSLNRWLEINHE